MKTTFSRDYSGGRFQTYTEKPGMNMLTVKQVHGTDFFLACNEDDIKEASITEADGIIADYSLPFPVAIKTADCLPVLILGEKGFALIHAGWKGLAAGILEKEEIGQIKPLEALIGPCIKMEHYEVGPEFKDNFKTNESMHLERGKIFFDLISEAKLSLEKLKPGISVKTSGICTWEDPNLHSHRKDQTKQRNWNIFFPNGN